MPPLQLLDNIAWHSLVGPHAAASAGPTAARRYARGFPPIIAFADTERPDFAALEPHCEVNERLYCAGWSGPVAAGWQLHADKLMLQMVWRAPPPAADQGFIAIRLGSEHVPQVLDLVALTNPGPFGPRVLELGEYVGCFDGPRLLAMAGERMHAGPLREISGVCTHPDFQGQGLARRLMQVLLRRGLQRGETPFLHVMRDNRHAHALYGRMGFEVHQELAVRVLSRSP